MMSEGKPGREVVRLRQKPTAAAHVSERPVAETLEALTLGMAPGAAMGTTS